MSGHPKTAARHCATARRRRYIAELGIGDMTPPSRRLKLTDQSPDAMLRMQFLEHFLAHRALQVHKTDCLYCFGL